MAKNATQRWLLGLWTRSGYSNPTHHACPAVRLRIASRRFHVERPGMVTQQIWTIHEVCGGIYGNPKNARNYYIISPNLTQRVHVGIWYILRAQRGSHLPTLRPKHIPYTYMDPLGNPAVFQPVWLRRRPPPLEHATAATTPTSTYPKGLKYLYGRKYGFCSSNFPYGLGKDSPYGYLGPFGLAPQPCSSS